ncbi:MAG: hypothetical protein J6T94_08420 [Bacteroidaceae bacterium]|nr:hypothetical protein [Bacteroidaceae bacterium]
MTIKRIYIAAVPLAFFFCAYLSSCDDMLDMGNVDVMYADKNHLTEGNDTVNSFVGILAQLQKVAVRTNLFGELRGDLVKVNSNARVDLKEISNFTVKDGNQYNSPRDYYAIINNCNYYLANADTALFESRYGAHNTYDFYVFRAEWTAVRAIRAWVYLQLGQIYGSGIPLVTDPILSIIDADDALANAPKKNLAGICEYFINDLKPYVEWFAYPYHGNPSHHGYKNDSPSRMSVIPIQLILGDLYLWRSSINQNPADAREAAKCYYDYLDWVPSDGGITNDNGYKVRNTTGNSKCFWKHSCLSSNNYTKSGASFYKSWFSTSKFGSAKDEVISAIAMESTSGLGFYNDLRKLYCYDMEHEDVEASISPSKACFDYSDKSLYFEQYKSGSYEKLVMVNAFDLKEELLNGHYLGDLRLPSTFSQEQRTDHDNLSQFIEKCYTPVDVVLYRTGDVYLRLAEALNYAGFPKFALAILTTGLDALVIENEVLAYCTNAVDSAFVEYFDFPTSYYQTRVLSYSPYTAVKGMEYLAVPTTYYSSDAFEVNQIGLHSRGCGLGMRTQLVMESGLYYPTDIDVPTDMSGYPVDLTDCTDDEFKAFAKSQGIVEPLAKDYATNREYQNAVEQYRLNYQTFYSEKRNEYLNNCLTWYKTKGLQQVKEAQIAAVDSLLDVEQALETCFEGFRFGDLMRAAYRKGDPSYLAQKVAKRDTALLGILSNFDNCFISWNGQIGK